MTAPRRVKLVVGDSRDESLSLSATLVQREGESDAAFDRRQERKADAMRLELGRKSLLRGRSGDDPLDAAIADALDRVMYDEDAF